MKKVPLLQFLITNQEESLSLMYLVLGIAAFFYFAVHLKDLTAFFVLAVVLFSLYYGIPIWVRRTIGKMAMKHSVIFNQTPEIEYPTSEKIIDSVDLEILRTIKDLGGNLYDFIPDIVEIYPFEDTIRRLGKLCSFNYIKIYRNGRVSITNLGLDTLNLPPAFFRSTVDPRIAGKIAGIRMDLQNEKYSDVIVETANLLEHLTKARTRERLGASLEKRWSEHYKDQRFDSAGLGKLIGFARKVKALDSFEYQIASAINEIRKSTVHDTGENQGLLVTPAVNALSLLEVLVRQW